MTDSPWAPGRLTLYSNFSGQIILAHSIESLENSAKSIFSTTRAVSSGLFHGDKLVVLDYILPRNEIRNRSRHMYLSCLQMVRVRSRPLKRRKSE